MEIFLGDPKSTTRLENHNTRIQAPWRQRLSLLSSLYPLMPNMNPLVCHTKEKNATSHINCFPLETILELGSHNLGEAKTL